MIAALLSALVGFVAGVAVCIWASFRLARRQREAERMRARANLTLSQLHEAIESTRGYYDSGADDLPVQ